MITKPRTLTNLWIDLASLIVMLGLAATGGLIHFVLPAGSGRFRELFGWNRHDIGHVHFYLAVAAVALLVLHVLLHWSWVCGVVAKALGRGFPCQRTRTVWGVGCCLGSPSSLSEDSGGPLAWFRQAPPTSEGTADRISKEHQFR